MDPYGSTSASPIKNKGAIGMPSVHWKLPPGLCHRLTWPGNILPKRTKRQGARPMRSVPLLARNNWAALWRKPARRKRERVSEIRDPDARCGTITNRASRIAHRVLSFQKQVHALEIDDRMTNVQRVHAQNAAGLCAALSQREMGQCDDAKLLARHHKIANLQITDARGTDMLRCASGKIG